MSGAEKKKPAIHCLYAAKDYPCPSFWTVREHYKIRKRAPAAST